MGCIGTVGLANDGKTQVIPLILGHSGLWWFHCYEDYLSANF